MSAYEYDRLEGHPDVRVQCVEIDDEDDAVTLFYIGSQVELVGLGICTQEMLEIQGKHAARKRYDRDGERYSKERYFVLRDGQPALRYRLRLVKSRTTALRLPGARMAIDALEAWCAKYRPAPEVVEEVVPQKEQPRRAHLRLVVSN